MFIEKFFLGPTYEYRGHTEEITSDPSAEKSIKLASWRDWKSIPQHGGSMDYLNHRCDFCPIRPEVDFN